MFREVIGNLKYDITSTHIAKPGAILVDTTTQTLYIHDGQTPGGVQVNAAVRGSATVNAAGTNQSTATALTAQYNIVTTVASGAGVILPSTLNTRIMIVNRGANALLVYPPVGAQLETYGTNAAVSVPTNNTAEFILVSSTQGYAV